MSSDFLIDLHDGVLFGRRTDPTLSGPLAGGPLLVALHGGGYTSAYFDIPGYSLLDRAAAAGCSAVAFDRPGYGGSSRLPFSETILQANAIRLSDGIAELWRRNGDEASGVVLVGHSIGAAITMLIASMEPAWPLLGIAVSGCGLASPPGRPAILDADVPNGLIEVSNDVRASYMFGPPGSFADDAPEKAAAANQPIVFREVVEIATCWPTYSSGVLAKIRAPAHYRQAE